MVARDRDECKGPLEETKTQEMSCGDDDYKSG